MLRPCQPLPPHAPKPNPTRTAPHSRLFARSRTPVRGRLCRQLTHKKYEGGRSAPLLSKEMDPRSPRMSKALRSKLVVSCIRTNPPDSEPCSYLRANLQFRTLQTPMGKSADSEHCSCLQELNTEGGMLLSPLSQTLPPRRPTQLFSLESSGAETSHPSTARSRK